VFVDGPSNEMFIQGLFSFGACGVLITRAPNGSFTGAPDTRPANCTGAFFEGFSMQGNLIPGHLDFKIFAAGTLEMTFDGKRVCADKCF